MATWYIMCHVLEEAVIEARQNVHNETILKRLREQELQEQRNDH